MPRAGTDRLNGRSGAGCKLDAVPTRTEVPEEKNEPLKDPPDPGFDTSHFYHIECRYRQVKSQLESDGHDRDDDRDRDKDDDDHDKDDDGRDDDREREDDDD